MVTKTKRKATRLTDRQLKEFARKAQPMAIGLVRCSTRLDREAYVAMRRANGKLSRVVRSSFELGRLGKGSFDALANFSLVVRNEGGTQTGLEIDSQFAVHFHTEETVGPKLAQEFADSFLAFLIWPYFRQFVIDTTSRMAISPVTLPPLPQSEA